ATRALAAAEAFFLPHTALWTPDSRSGGVQAEGVRAGQQAAGAVPRRPAADEDNGDHVRLRVLRQPAAPPGTVQQWTLEGLTAPHDSPSGRGEERSQGVRLLRRRSWRRGGGVPDAEVHGQPAVRTQ